MTLGRDLARLACGVRPDGDWLLATCALTTRGGDVYGEEAIVAAFGAQPLVLDGAVVTSPRGVALFGSGGALVADVFDGHVARLWRVGGTAAAAESAVAVAFDPDLAQPRGDVVVDPAAVDLAAADLDGIVAALRPVVRDAASDAFRHRAFVIRAFADGNTVAALVALYAAAADGIGFRYAALALADDTITIVADPPAAMSWTPRL